MRAAPRSRSTARTSRSRSSLGPMPLVLQRISAELGDRLVAGDLSGVDAADGWPHDDTIDGLTMAVQHGFPFWLVLLDGRVIGDCGTFGPPDESGSVEIGYGLAAPFRGRGHGRELVDRLVRIVLADDGVERVTAKVLRTNVASCRTLARVGFGVEQSDDEHVWYELSAAQLR